MPGDTEITVVYSDSGHSGVWRGGFCHDLQECAMHSVQFSYWSDLVIEVTNAKATSHSTPTLAVCTAAGCDNSSTGSWTGGLEALGGSEAKRKGSAREHFERNVQIYFSRQDRLWLWAPFLACDSYVNLVKLARGWCSAGAEWLEKSWRLCVAIIFESRLIISII